MNAEEMAHKPLNQQQKKMKHEHEKVQLSKKAEPVSVLKDVWTLSQERVLTKESKYYVDCFQVNEGKKLLHKE